MDVAGRCIRRARGADEGADFIGIFFAGRSLDAGRDIDALRPRDADRLGKTFDWTLLAGLNAGVPFMLSGGLDAGNVAEAIRIARPQGVDVSSGVERSPGEKDPDKIRAFIRAARAADASLNDVQGDRKVRL